MRYNTKCKPLLGYFWIIFLLSLLAGLPTLSHAAGVVLDDTSNGAFFTPAAADQSILYLGELFGSVPPVLAGTGSALMGNLFKLFNTAVLTLGILFAAYTTFVGVLNTAGEGEMLGKGWSSIWVPIRTVAGIALLIPTASGYCVCQVFMIWLLVQGVGAADTLTAKIIEYMRSGQQVFVPGNTGGASGQNGDAVTYNDTIKTLYQGLSCMQSYAMEFPSANPGYTTPPNPSFSTDKTAVNYKFSAFKNTTNPDGTVSAASEVDCGQIEINNNNTAALDYLAQGVNAIMPSLNAAAYFMVNDTPIAEEKIDEETTVMKDTYNFVGADFINEVEDTYLSYVIQANNAFGVSTHGKEAYYEDIQSYGWSTLGGLYWDMAETRGKSNSDANSSAKLAWAGHNISTQPSADYDPSEYYSAKALKYGNTWATQFIDDLIASRNTEGSSGHGFNEAHKKDYAGAATDAMGALTMGTLNAMLIKFKDGRNPMIVAHEMGHEIIMGTEAALTALAAILTLTAAFSGTGSSLASGYLVFETAMAFVLPGVFLFAGMLLVLGGTLSVVIPFIPALAYFMAVIAWLVAALETIVAAPIVAIGVIHPEGHAVWGKAEPAILLMTNMFLRPSLIVVGMAAGVILSFISLQFINFGYEVAMQKVLGTSAPTSIEAALYLTTYVALVLACVNKSFSTIDAIPEQVMRWIQGGEATKFGGGQDAMQKLQGAQEQQGSKSGEGSARGAQESGGAGSKGSSAYSSARQAKINRAEDKAEAERKDAPGNVEPQKK